MTLIAAGSESIDDKDWIPSKIYLSVGLMWDILQFNYNPSQGMSTAGILDASLAPIFAHEDTDESSILEINVATSPEITVNTADGGQDSPMLSFRAPASSAPASAAPASSRNTISSDMFVEP